MCRWLWLKSRNLFYMRRSYFPLQAFVSPVVCPVNLLSNTPTSENERATSWMNRSIAGVTGYRVGRTARIMTATELAGGITRHGSELSPSVQFSFTYSLAHSGTGLKAVCPARYIDGPIPLPQPQQIPLYSHTCCCCLLLRDICPRCSHEKTRLSLDHGCMAAE